MNDELALLVTVGIGGLVGWWLKRRQGPFPRKILAIVAALAIGVPVLLFVLAVASNSETLAWVAGLGLMVESALGVLLLAGAVIGWMLAPKPREEESAAIAMPQSAAPQPPPNIPCDQPETPDLTSRGQRRGVLVAMAAVGSFFWVLLWVGFRLHGQQPPAEIDHGIVPAGLVFITTIALGVRSLWRSRAMLAARFALPDISIDIFATRRYRNRQRQWLASLAADPRRQRYAAMIEAGDSFWTPERIEYDLDPNATCCCEHLAPIESEMRVSGVIVRMGRDGVAVAECRIDAAALSRRFNVPVSGYQEFHIPDRSIHDPPEARVYCDACPSTIWVSHPDVAVKDTPLFPTSG